MRSMLNKFTAFFLLLLLICLNISGLFAQVRPVYDMGAIGLGQQLKRLQTTASAMHTGAHPDDEDSNLIAYLARGKNARTVYLALNRGEGGQNVIGPELFEPLGVIRTEELLQARRLDGGQQMFTNVMDYGFSKKRSEAARIWGEQPTLAEMVRAVRTFRPLVIISRFTGTPSDGHGQHQLAGYLTPLAYKAAADPNQFPEQIREGLLPWQAKKLYVGQSFNAPDSEPTSVRLSTGEYDPLIGRSYAEIASEGRSQHKTQQMGTIERRGAQFSGEKLLESTVTGNSKTDIFDGIDTSIKGIASITNDNESGLADRLAALQETAETALRDYDAYAPSKLVPVLAKGVTQARAAKEATKNPYAKALLEEKEQEFSHALQTAAGIVVDALSDTDTIVAGDSTQVTVNVFGANAKVGKITLSTPEGWSVADSTAPKTGGNNFFFRPETADHSTYLKLTAAANASPTQPYWLEKPRTNFTFDWSAPDAVKNAPFQHQLVTASVPLNIGGVDITVAQPLQYRYADGVRGEIRRDLNVVPLVTLEPDTNLMVVPTGAQKQTKRVVVSLTNNAPRQTAGTIDLSLPAGWTAVPASANFDLATKGLKTAVAFDVTIPAGTKAGKYDVTAEAKVGGSTYDRSMQEIEYPHIQTHRRYLKATVTTQVLDLKVAPVKVGYVMGSGDSVPAAIARMGIPVTMLEEKDLASGDLSKFDVIVVGIRASETRPDFVANNGRLIDFMRNGGTLIVQYQQSVYTQKNMLPFDAKTESAINGVQRISNVRVVDENAPVKILVPDNPIFNYPNKIVNSDWDNWVQERNLYTLSQLDANYVALTETADEGEAPVTGGLVYAKVGKGLYVYNAYSFFRQLPAGVPGAYRLFANMLSLPKAPRK
ncbi:MAG: NEW3 domain-containing protein [Pyrinomonadaceae bacterium]|nr:NEW3 domain-containing protein [Pyrinomonadaceae bacterium]